MPRRLLSGHVASTSPRMEVVVNRLQRFFFRAPIGLYRIGLGGLLGRRFLLLEHTGRSSGLTRRTVLEVLETGADGAPVIASGFGERSQWCRNVMADPVVHVTRGRARRPAVVERLGHEPAVAVLEQYRVDHARAARTLGNRLGVSLVDELDTAADRIPLFRVVDRAEGGDTAGPTQP